MVAVAAVLCKEDIRLPQRQLIVVDGGDGMAIISLFFRMQREEKYVFRIDL